jgi:hypothetical protein
MHLTTGYSKILFLFLCRGMLRANWFQRPAANRESTARFDGARGRSQTGRYMTIW